MKEKKNTYRLDFLYPLTFQSFHQKSQPTPKLYCFAFSFKKEKISPMKFSFLAHRQSFPSTFLYYRLFTWTLPSTSLTVSELRNAGYVRVSLFCVTLLLILIFIIFVLWFKSLYVISLSFSPPFFNNIKKICWNDKEKILNCWKDRSGKKGGRRKKKCPPRFGYDNLLHHIIRHATVFICF